MPDILVRDVEETVLQRLKDRARQNGRSLQKELKLLFRSITETDSISDEETASEIKESLRGRVFSDSTELLREDRSR